MYITSPQIVVLYIVLGDSLVTAATLPLGMGTLPTRDMALKPVPSKPTATSQPKGAASPLPDAPAHLLIFHFLSLFINFGKYPQCVWGRTCL